MWKRLVTTSVWVVPVLAAYPQETEFGLEQSSGTQGKRSETQIDALEKDLDSIEESGGVSFKSKTRRGAILDIEGYGHFAAAEAGSLATKPTVAAENALRGVAGLASLTLQHDRTSGTIQKTRTQSICRR